MGFCFSCCRRRKKEDDEEQRPLLSNRSDPLKPPRTPLERTVDVLAAFHAGKLPSQRQVDTALQRLKHSGLFNPDEVAGAPNQAGDELQKVVDDARNVVDVLLQIGMEKNNDDRMQDMLYNMRLLSKPINMTASGEVRVDVPLSSAGTAAAAIPPPDEVSADAAAFISSLRDILFLTLTSSAFRFILSDLLDTFREIVAQGAEKVKVAAATVKNVAETVEVDMRSAGAVERDIELPHEPNAGTVTVKDTLLGRFEDILRQAQSSPRHNAALRTLLFLLRKYAFRIKLASDALQQAAVEAKEKSSVEVSLPVLIPDPRFSRIVEDLKVLLERFASRQSLDPLLTALSDLISNVCKVAENGTSTEAQLFFDKLGDWLDRALTDTQFASSRAGRESASNLFDEGQNLLTQDADLSNNVNRLMEETSNFARALGSDRTTTRLVEALDLLQKDTAFFLQETARRGQHAAAHWKSTLARLVIGWTLPRILRIIHTIPMPRVEYVQRRGDFTQLAVALDTLLLEAEEALVPDVLQVQEWAEVRIELDERLGAAELTNPNARILGASENGTSESTALLASMLDMHQTPTVSRQRRTRTHSSSRVRVHIEGLRLAVRDVGYYALYSASSWLGYADEGVVSAEIGRSGARGEGLSLDLELEIDSDAYGPSAKRDRRKPLYRVVNVQTAVPGLALHLAHTRHWVINSLLAPLAGPVGRLIAPSILNSQVRSALEKLEEFFRGVKQEAEEKAAEREDVRSEQQNEDAGLADWWNALLERFGNGTANQNDDRSDDSGDSDEDEPEVYTESRTEANLKGVVRRTIEQREPSADASAAIPPPTESALAVGLGAQLLPGHGEPDDAHRTALSDVGLNTAREARDVIDEVEGVVEDVSGAVRGATEQGIRTAMDTRRAIEGAENRLEARENVERRKRGWQSRAFDLA